MINKEFIVGSGGIIKDFQDRNIPQNSNNFVSVGVLIPVSEFADLGTYGVCLATSKIVGGVETSLPSLICYSAKTLKIEGVDYIKYQCQLSIQYTNYIGQLKLTPYIIEIETLNEGEEDEEVVITTQKTFTNTTLNVIRSIASTSDASLEDAEAVDTLTALIQAKNIKLIDDYKTGTKAQAIVGCFTDYNASAYEGWLLIVKYSGGEFALLPYKNGANNEFTEIDLDGTYYKLSDYSSGTYTSTQLTYTKGEIDTILTSYYTKSETYSDDEVDTLLSGKVDKTQQVNGHALSGNITITKSDVGLGNVQNYGIVNSPSADANNKYVDAGGLYTYLITNYADKSDYDTTKQKVNTMWAMFQDDGNDVVDTLYDLLKVFENFPEADTIAPILSGIESRLDTLESMGNVVVNCGSTTLPSESWVENADDYASDYPYKYEYTNSLLVGATNFDVIFGVDADTSLLSTTAILDNTTGTITFYASEIPSENIAIENIVAFTNLNAINTLTTDTINQVQQNKNDISDLNTNCIKKSATSGLVKNDGTIDTTTYVKETNTYYNNGLYAKYLENKDNSASIELRVVAPDYTSHQIYASGNLVGMEDMYKASSTKNLVSAVLLQNGKAKIINSTWESGEKTAEHTLEFDEDGNLTLDGNAVGGGGKQLYQHNITINHTDGGSGSISLQIINDSNVAFTLSSLWTYIQTNFSYDDSSNKKGLACSGLLFYTNSTPYLCVNIFYYPSSDFIRVGCVQINGNYSNFYNLNFSFSSSQATLTDAIIAL